MTDRKNIRFEIERFKNSIENYDNTNKPELNLQISKYSDDFLANSTHLKRIITENETLSSVQIELNPNITRSMLVENNINFKEDDKFPEQKSDKVITFIKENPDSNTISNLINSSLTNTLNEDKSKEKSPAISSTNNINANENLSFNSPNLLKELLENSSEEANEVKSEDKLLTDNNKKIEEKLEKSNQGRWTPEEHLKFIEAIWLYGSEWKKVQIHIGTRSSSQARSHAQKFFIRLKRRFTTSKFFKGVDSINEQNFTVVIDWINESLDTNHLNFLNSKKLKFDDYAKRFCRVIINLMNTSGDNRSRKKSDASINEKNHEEFWDRNVFERHDVQKFNKFSLLEEKSFNINNIKQMDCNNKIKIPLDSDHLDDYFNFSHSDSLSQGSMNLARKTSSNKNEVEGIFLKNYSSTIRKVSNQNTGKIFEIKKDKKKNMGENGLKQTTKIISDHFKKEKKESASNRSRKSSVTDSKCDRNEVNIKRNKEQFDPNPHIKMNKYSEWANCHKPKLDNSNKSRPLFDNLNGASPGINSSSDPNVFIDPDKNQYINIVNINYGCNNDFKPETKTNPIMNNKTLFNNISAKTEGVPINDVTNYSNKINSIYNVKCSKSENDMNNCFVKQNGASYSNKVGNSNTSFLNFPVAQKILCNMPGNHPSNYFMNNETQSNEYHAPANNELNKNAQMNLLYQMFCYCNQHQAAMQNQFNYNSHLNVPQSNKCNSCSGCLYNQANSHNHLNSGYNGIGKGINHIKKNKNKAGNANTNCERTNRNTVDSSNNSHTIKNLKYTDNYQIFPNFNQDYMNMNKDLYINPMNNLKIDSIGKPPIHPNNIYDINATNVDANPNNNSLSFLQNNIKFGEADSSNKQNNPFNITFDDKKASYEECMNIFSATPDVRNFLKSDKEEDIFHNFDLSAYFKADGY